jgi:hypothetical protein
VVIAIMARRPNPLFNISVGRSIQGRMEHYPCVFKQCFGAPFIELTRRG